MAPKFTPPENRGEIARRATIAGGGPHPRRQGYTPIAPANVRVGAGDPLRAPPSGGASERAPLLARVTRFLGERRSIAKAISASANSARFPRNISPKCPRCNAPRGASDIFDTASALSRPVYSVLRFRTLSRNVGVSVLVRRRRKVPTREVEKSALTGENEIIFSTGTG